MPCIYHESASEAREREIKHKGMTTQECEAVLCGIFSKFATKDLLDLLDFNEIGVPRNRVERWWGIHKEIDRKRMEREKAKEMRKEADEREELKRLIRKYGR